MVHKAQSTCSYVGCNLVVKTDVSCLITQLINYYSGKHYEKKIQPPPHYRLTKELDLVFAVEVEESMGGRGWWKDP